MASIGKATGPREERQAPVMPKTTANNSANNKTAAAKAENDKPLFNLKQNNKGPVREELKQDDSSLFSGPVQKEDFLTGVQELGIEKDTAEIYWNVLNASIGSVDDDVISEDEYKKIIDEIGSDADNDSKNDELTQADIEAYISNLMTPRQENSLDPAAEVTLERALDRIVSDMTPQEFAQMQAGNMQTGVMAQFENIVDALSTTAKAEEQQEVYGPQYRPATASEPDKAETDKAETDESLDEDAARAAALAAEEEAAATEEAAAQAAAEEETAAAEEEVVAAEAAAEEVNETVAEAESEVQTLEKTLSDLESMISQGQLSAEGLNSFNGALQIAQQLYGDTLPEEVKNAQELGDLKSMINYDDIKTTRDALKVPLGSMVVLNSASGKGRSVGFALGYNGSGDSATVIVAEVKNGKYEINEYRTHTTIGKNDRYIRGFVDMSNGQEQSALQAQALSAISSQMQNSTLEGIKIQSPADLENLGTGHDKEFFDNTDPDTTKDITLIQNTYGTDKPSAIAYTDAQSQENRIYFEGDSYQGDVTAQELMDARENGTIDDLFNKKGIE